LNIQRAGHWETGSPANGVEPAIFASLFRFSMLWTPERDAPSAWVEHVPFAFWLVDVLRPRRLVELGTHTGVSYSAMCQAVKTLGLATSCFSIDTWKGDEHAGLYGEDVYGDFAAFHNQRYGTFSQLVRSTFDEALHHFEDGSIDLLHIDGLHTYEAVRHDYEAWLPKLTANAVVLFHDTNVRERDFGAFRLWNEIAAGRPHFDFLHGYGLGVLGHGQEYADALRVMFGASEDDRLVTTIRETFGTLGRSVRELSERSQLDQSLAVHVSELGRLREALAACEGELAGLREERAQNVGDISRLQEALTAREDKLAALGEERTQNVREIGTLQEALTARADKLAALKEESAQNVGKIATLQEILAAQLQRSTRELDELRTALGARDCRLALLEQRPLDNDTQISALRTELAARNMDVASREATICALRTSTSWRITAPLRATKQASGGLAYAGPVYPFTLAWRAVTIRSLMPLRNWRDERVIARSGLFDKDWYLTNNPDVGRRGINPIRHYVAFGAKEGRDPSPSFSTRQYLLRNRDVATAGMNPFAHYVLCGAAEGRNTGKSSIAAQSIDADKRSRAWGANTAMFASPVGGRVDLYATWFDAEFYRAQVPGLAEAGLDPLTHYVTTGWREGYDPHPLFSVSWYLAAHPELADAGVEPLRHFYETAGFPTALPAPYVPPGRNHFVSTDAHALFSRLTQLEVLSLDIFDTALVRRVAHPTAVFALMEATAVGRDPRFAGFADLRFRAEREARRLATEAGRSPEIGFDEIYDVVAREWWLSADDRTALETLELETERQVLVANPVVLRWYERARALGKRVIFVSDMYLPTAFLTEVLDAAGYAEPEVYVSNGYGVGKWQKTLFDEAAKGCGASGDRILHLGDNAQSDRDCAEAAGWNALHYTEGEVEQPFALQLANPGGLDSGNVSVSVGLGLARTHRLAIETSGEAFADRFARHLGYEVVGPTVLAFAGWVATQAVAHGLDRVLFLARDGFLPQRVYEMLCARGFPACEGRYVLASRRMLYNRLYATEEAVRKEVSRLDFSRDTTFADYLDIFLLSDEEVRHCADLAGVADINAPVLQQLSATGDYVEAHRALNRIVGMIAPLVVRKAREAARLQDAYYREAAAVGGARRIGLVDLGWAGSIIEPLRRILVDIAGQAEVRAYFFGLNPRSREVMPSSVPTRTYSFDNVGPREPSPGEIPSAAQPQDVLGASLSLMEVLISENCTTSIGLVRDEITGGLRPVFAADTYTDAHRRFLRLAHEEAEAFARDALLLLPASPVRWDFGPLLSHVWNRVLSSPDEEEARLLASFPHRIDASSHPATTTLVSYGVAPGSSLLDQFRASMWPAGWFALLAPEERARLLAEVEAHSDLAARNLN
jgi:FMN phosphatase YigB (HAD superfamily)